MAITSSSGTSPPAKSEASRGWDEARVVGNPQEPRPLKLTWDKRTANGHPNAGCRHFAQLLTIQAEAGSWLHCSLVAKPPFRSCQGPDDQLLAVVKHKEVMRVPGPETPKKAGLRLSTCTQAHPDPIPVLHKSAAPAFDSELLSAHSALQT